jgi:hypothetical protein
MIDSCDFVQLLIRIWCQILVHLFVYITMASCLFYEHSPIVQPIVSKHWYTFYTSILVTPLSLLLSPSLYLPNATIESHPYMDLLTAWQTPELQLPCLHTCRTFVTVMAIKCKTTSSVLPYSNDRKEDKKRSLIQTS